MMRVPVARPQPTRQLPARDRGGVKEIYVPEDTRKRRHIEEDESDDSEAKKRGKQFDTSPQKRTATPQITLSSDPKGALLATHAAIPPHSPHSLEYALCDTDSTRPQKAPKSVTHGPRRGAGAGIIDELLNAFPCAPESLTRFWRRYMVCAALRCRLRVRMLCGTWQFDKAARKIVATRATHPDARLANEQGYRVPSYRTYYIALLEVHKTYYADVSDDLTATDLDQKEKKRQTRRLRRVAYAKLSKEARLVGVKPWLWQDMDV
jgi:hypothetical protein